MLFNDNELSALNAQNIPVKNPNNSNKKTKIERALFKEKNLLILSDIKNLFKPKIKNGKTII